MPVNADDHFVIWMVGGNLCDRYLPIGAIPIEAEQIGEKVAVTTHAERVTSVDLCRQVKEATGGIVSDAKSRADCAAYAVLLLYLVGVPVVVPIAVNHRYR